MSGSDMKDIVIHLDGHTREKQKFGTYGFVVREGGKIIDTKQSFIGSGISNLQAERQAFLKTLKYIKDNFNDEERKVRVFLDNGEVYNEYINKSNELMKSLIEEIEPDIEVKKVPSERVKEAHLLCSSEYSNLHPFPGYIRDLKPEPLIT